jgi:hypothetical protein
MEARGDCLNNPDEYDECARRSDGRTVVQTFIDNACTKKGKLRLYNAASLLLAEEEPPLGRKTEIEAFAVTEKGLRLGIVDDINRIMVDGISGFADPANPDAFEKAFGLQIDVEMFITAADGTIHGVYLSFVLWFNKTIKMLFREINK